MPRFQPLTEQSMTDAQRKAAQELASGPRGRMNPHGPNALLLRSPDLMARTQKVGEYLRYHNSLPERIKEFAILVTARHWGAQVEWLEHHPLALKAGLDASAAEDLRLGREPRGLNEDEAAAYRFLTELHRNKRVSDATFDEVARRFGERGVIDLIGVTGYYSMLAMVLNVADGSLPEGKQPPLPPVPSS